MTLKVLITRLDESIPAPRYAKPGDAGADICTRIDLTIEPGERALAPTGLSIALPDGYAAFVHPRSGLAIKHGVSLVNTPGTVDAGFRGELQIILSTTTFGKQSHLKREIASHNLSFKK